MSQVWRWLEYNLNLWLRPLIILGVVAASAYLGPRASERYLLVLVAVAIAVCFLRWPPLGLVILVGPGLIIPFAIGTGTGTELNATVLLLGLLLGLWLLTMVHRRHFHLVASRAFLPLFAFIGVDCLAFVAGYEPWLLFVQTAPIRTQLGGLGVFILSAGAFLLVAHQIRDERWLEWLTWAFLVLGLVFIVSRVVPGLEGVSNRYFTIAVTGSLFWTWLVALAVGQAAFNPRLPLLGRLALWGLALTVLYIGLFKLRGWTSGWLPPLVALTVTLVAGAPRLGLLASGVGGGVIAFKLPEVIAMVMVGDNEYSTMTRLEAWRILLEIVKANPVLGLGPANYYWYTPLFPILGYAVSFNSHNNYIDIVAQTGILGLACFLWFAWEVGRLGWRLRSAVPQGFAQAYVYGALGGLAGTLVAAALGDWVLPFVYNIGLAGMRSSLLAWLFLGGLVALEQMTRQSKP